jgi:hypothetical protein
MIKTINKFSEIDTSSWDDKTLLLLDIDDTIVVPKEKVIRNANHDKRVYFQDKIKEYIGEEMVDKILENQGYMFVDNNFMDFYNKVNIPKICITTRRTGKMLSTSKPSEDLIIDDLNKLGVKLDPKKYPNNARINLDIHDAFTHVHDDLYNFYKQDSQMIKDGIIFCCNVNKNEVLLYYFYLLLEKPNKIIVIDDKLKTLELIKKFCDYGQLKCDYELYHFRGVDLLDNKISDKEVNNRIDYMIKTQSYAPESDFTIQ